MKMISALLMVPFVTLLSCEGYKLNSPGRMIRTIPTSKMYGIRMTSTDEDVKTYSNTPYAAPSSVPCLALTSRWRKCTKQVATVGPASNNIDMLEKLFLSGVDVFRLNFSHGEHAEKGKLVQMIREVEAKYNHPIGILADLQGPKLRVGVFEKEKVILVEGQLFKFDLKDEAGDSYRVRLPHPEILNTLRTGDVILLDDGKLRMKVVETTIQPDGSGDVTCEVLVGGSLSNRKGVNTPTIVLPISPMTPKDRRDLDFILTLDVDWVALSFVQRPQDILEMREIVGDRLKIMAKLEKPSAINYLDEIVDVADGCMVARGDLGVETNPWDVPVIQKRIVETCKLLGKPVIVATQMMESMIESPTCTRAEASDCATAIFDSADGVMLSAESAAGRYPVESVSMQQRIIEKVESDEVYIDGLNRFAVDSAVQGSKDMTTNAMVLAARQAASLSKSKAILAYTAKGGTVTRIARLRPTVPIVAVTTDWKTARWLTMVWGVYSVIVPPPSKSDEFNFSAELRKGCDAAVARGYADPERDLFTVTAGLPWGNVGTTNVVRIVCAAGPDYWIEGSTGKAKLSENAVAIDKK